MRVEGCGAAVTDPEDVEGLGLVVDAVGQGLFGDVSDVEGDEDGGGEAKETQAQADRLGLGAEVGLAAEVG